MPTSVICSSRQCQPALPLFTVVRIDPVRVFVDVPEMDAPLVDPARRR